MMGRRLNFTFGTLALGAFPFGTFTFSTFTFITLLPINLALLGANLFSRVASIEPFKGLFNIIFICVFILVHVFILILGNRGFPFGTTLHSTDLAFLGSVTIYPFTSIFGSIFTFRFEFINVFGILFRTVFESIEIFIPSIGSMILITVITLFLIFIIPLIFIPRSMDRNRSCQSGQCICSSCLHVGIQPQPGCRDRSGDRTML